MVSVTWTVKRSFRLWWCCCCLLGTGRVPDQLINLDMKHGVEAKNYEEVSAFLVEDFKCVMSKSYYSY